MQGRRSGKTVVSDIAIQAALARGDTVCAMTPGGPVMMRGDVFWIPKPRDPKWGSVGDWPLPT